MAWKDIVEHIDRDYKGILILLTVLAVGVSIGISIVGFRGLPALAAQNFEINSAQNASLDSLRARDIALDQKIERLTCLMTAQFEGTNPLRCNSGG